jgi:nucleoside-diphosphate-sugar epimerase
MKEFVENKDFIFHLAGANRASDEELMRINTTGTLNLLEAIRKYSDAETRIIFASSLQV